MQQDEIGSIVKLLLCRLAQPSPSVKSDLDLKKENKYSKTLYFGEDSGSLHYAFIPEGQSHQGAKSN
jgi:hypothetical protein